MIIYIQTGHNGNQQRFTGAQIKDVVPTVLEYRLKEHLPRADYNSVFNDILSFVSHSTPSPTVALAEADEKVGVNPCYDAVRQRGKMTLEKASTGAKAILGNVSGKAVGQDEIYRRGKICEDCVMRTSSSDCHACSAGRKIQAALEFAKRTLFMKSFIIPKSLSRDYCCTCGCSLAALLPAPLSAIPLDDEQTKKLRPDYCWQNTPEREDKDGN